MRLQSFSGCQLLRTSALGRRGSAVAPAERLRLALRTAASSASSRGLKLLLLRASAQLTRALQTPGQRHRVELPCGRSLRCTCGGTNKSAHPVPRNTALRPQPTHKPKSPKTPWALRLKTLRGTRSAHALEYATCRHLAHTSVPTLNVLLLLFYL